MLANNVTRFRETINQKFRKFTEEEDKRFNHITRILRNGVILNVFSYYIKENLRVGLALPREVDEVWYYLHRFPIAKVVASGNKELEVGTILGLPIGLTALIENKSFVASSTFEKQAPEPKQVEVPQFIRLIDHDEDWKSKRYFDPLVQTKEDDFLFLLPDYMLNLFVVYDRNKLTDLNNIIDGKL